MKAHKVEPCHSQRFTHRMSDCTLKEGHDGPHVAYLTATVRGDERRYSTWRVTWEIAQ